MAKSKEEEKLPPEQAMLESYLRTTKDDHFNFEEDFGGYHVSSGSKRLDVALGGGIPSGMVRFIGNSEGGKTSAAYLVIKNFLEFHKKEGHKAKALAVIAEGRLGAKMKARTGVKFVYSAKEWVDGTCFVFETNIYETASGFLRKFMEHQKTLKPEDRTYLGIIFDSMDGLMSKKDQKKEIGDKTVAASALLTSDFCRKTSLALNKRGHLAIFIGQDRAVIRGQYEKVDRNRQGSASGGNAAVHYPNLALEFIRPRDSDTIKENSDAMATDENKILGHYAQVLIHKSENESSLMRVRYPIKRGRMNGKSVWAEREVIDLLIAWGFFDKKGAWYSTGEEISEITGEFKCQGLDKLYEKMELEPELFEKCVKFFDENVMTLL